MSLLKSLMNLVDDSLETLFHQKAPDATKARAKALKTIATAKKQFASTEPTKGRKAWKAGGGDVIAFTGGYKIDGRATVYVPSSRFHDFLIGLEKAIHGGELDDALLLDESDAIVGKRTGVKDAHDRFANAKVRKVRGPLSPEKLAARRAKVAAKKG